MALRCNKPDTREGYRESMIHHALHVVCIQMSTSSAIQLRVNARLNTTVRRRLNGANHGHLDTL